MRPDVTPASELHRTKTLALSGHTGNRFAKRVCSKQVYSIMTRLYVSTTLFCAALAAQPPVQTPPQVPVQTPPATSEQTPVHSNGNVMGLPEFCKTTGKPITLPFECTGDDIHFSGMACSEEDPCPIYLELLSAEGAGGRIFSAGNIHGEAVTLYSVLLASEDGGHTWSEAFPRQRGVALDRIQLLDGSGWVSGQTAFPIAQDPFFLVTADNGATWQRHPIFSASSYGSIVQLAF